MRFVVGFVLVLGWVANASAVTLYDGSLNTLPASQGWLSHYSFGGGVQTLGTGKTTYDSSALDGIQGGYSTHTFLGALVNPSSPVLNRAIGYTVSFDLKLLSEAHPATNRAGLSVIALSSDLQGIELAFWDNEIWEQPDATFTNHGTGVAYNATTASKTYDLTVLGSNYTLFGNGSPIISGTLKDYTVRGFPYNTPSWIFLGDDTTSARGSFEFSRLAVVVPEPQVLLASLSALALLRSRGRRPA